ncbi:nucleotidyltransferase family protein [Yoonia sp. R2331]|uniref:nucleotidyltransferase family protein n=1 Tax=Yoonia sp. R2331 TaxID=3237238 RepID=UPI0034E5E735
MTTYPILLFAAGLGTRMGNLTRDRPKPLISVAGRNLLDHALDLTRSPCVGRRVVNLHYKGQMIRDHLAGQDILFSDETDLRLETGGGLRQALPLLGGDPVLTLNTDAVWRGPNPIDVLCAAWRDTMQSLLLVVPQSRAIGHPGKGDFLIATDGQLSRGPGPIYTGLQLTRTAELNDIPDIAFSMNVLWDRAASQAGLFGVEYPGHWCDVGKPDSIPLAEELLSRHV